MERQKHNKAGESGFYHFYGVVEDRNDPKKLGRLRVRIFGKHTEDLSQLPTEHLPWAQIMLPLNATPNESPNVWDGQLVFGFFADGIEQQVPIITHQLAVNGESVKDAPGKKTTGFQDQRETHDVLLPDGSRANLGINTSVNNHENGHEGKYPYIHSKQTESGHIIEHDDTPGKESVTIMHRSGSIIKMLKDGTIEISAKKDCNISADGNINISANGNINANASGNFKAKASRIDLN
jgi:hypothetical protein